MFLSILTLKNFVETNEVIANIVLTVTFIINFIEVIELSYFVHFWYFTRNEKKSHCKCHKFKNRWNPDFLLKRKKKSLFRKTRGKIKHN